MHRNLGVACTVLAFVQFSALVFRPAKGQRYRFAWELWHHWVGRSAALLAIANVYYGSRLLFLFLHSRQGRPCCMPHCACRRACAKLTIAEPVPRPPIMTPAGCIHMGAYGSWTWILYSIWLGAIVAVSVVKDTREWLRCVGWGTGGAQLPGRHGMGGGGEATAARLLPTGAHHRVPLLSARLPQGPQGGPGPQAAGRAAGQHAAVARRLAHGAGRRGRWGRHAHR